MKNSTIVLFHENGGLVQFKLGNHWVDLPKMYDNWNFTNFKYRMVIPFNIETDIKGKSVINKLTNKVSIVIDQSKEHVLLNTGEKLCYNCLLMNYKIIKIETCGVIVE